MMEYDDEYFMRQALREANNAYAADEVPIGAVLVINQKIISRDHNRVEQLHDPTAHAEILVVTGACDHLAAKYLPDATLYVTIEPCHMCAGALYWSKVKRIVFGASDAKQGYQTFYGNRNPFHPKTVLTYGVLAGECAQLMKDFFKQKR